MQSETALLILNNLQKSIEILDQSGIDNTRALVQIIPMVLPDQLINKIKQKKRNVGYVDVSLNDHTSGLHPSLAGSYAFLYPLSNHALRAT
jgi:hypothetical protein